MAEQALVQFRVDKDLKEALNAFEAMRQETAGMPELTLDEINEEIAASRTERRSRKAAL